MPGKPDTVWPPFTLRTFCQWKENFSGGKEDMQCLYALGDMQNSHSLGGPSISLGNVGIVVTSCLGSVPVNMVATSHTWLLSA